MEDKSMELNKKQATAQNLTSVQGGANQPPQFDIVEASKPTTAVNNGADVNAGLAAMFGKNTQQTKQQDTSATISPSKVVGGNVPGQQGLAGVLGNYRSMWQPNGGNNYQVIGGVGNII